MARADDRFANVLPVEVVMSAANTLTFAQVETGVSLGTGIGLLIDQINYYIPFGEVSELLTSADTIKMAWVNSDALTDLVADERRVIDMVELSQTLTTSGVIAHKSPIIHQFFPPLIRATPRMWLACVTAGFAGAATVRSRLFFRYIDLNTQEYLELAESGLSLF